MCSPSCSQLHHTLLFAQNWILSKTFNTKPVLVNQVHTRRRECGYSHTKSHGSWVMCEVKFVVSSMAMYNTWYLFVGKCNMCHCLMSNFHLNITYIFICVPFHNIMLKHGIHDWVFFLIRWVVMLFLIKLDLLFMSFLVTFMKYVIINITYFIHCKWIIDIDHKVYLTHVSWASRLVDFSHTKSY